jgi:DNA-binding NarL/FixJ family response regulator
VVLLDHHLAGADGLQLCAKVTRHVLAPRVLVYTAYASPELTIPAVLAGAVGIVGKDAEARVLFDAIRRAGRGERVLPPITRPMLERATARVGVDDAPVLAMAVDGCSLVEIAEALRTEPEDVRRRLVRMVGRLRVEAPAA